MRLAGAACILAGAVLWRRTLARERGRRRAALWDLSRALRRLGEEVRLARRPLPGLLSELAEACGEDAGQFLRDVAASLRGDGDLETAWREAADGPPLSEQERQVLASVGSELRGDEERLRRAVLAAAERLEEGVRDLDAGERDVGRREAALAFSAAALLIVLLY